MSKHAHKPQGKLMHTMWNNGDIWAPSDGSHWVHTSLALSMNRAGERKSSWHTVIMWNWDTASGNAGTAPNLSWNLQRHHTTSHSNQNYPNGPIAGWLWQTSATKIFKMFSSIKINTLSLCNRDNVCRIQHSCRRFYFSMFDSVTCLLQHLSDSF